MGPEKASGPVAVPLTPPANANAAKVRGHLMTTL